MARIHGRRGIVYIDVSAAGTGSAEPVAYLNSWSLNLSVDNAEVTAFGDTNKTYVAGLPDASGSYAGFYDTDSAQLYNAATGGEARKFYLYPDRTDTTEYFFGTGLFDMNIETPVGGGVTVSGDFSAASQVQKVG